MAHTAIIEWPQSVFEFRPLDSATLSDDYMPQILTDLPKPPPTVFSLATPLHMLMKTELGNISVQEIAFTRRSVPNS